MAIILLVLLLALILGGLGFAIHVLWWIALIVLVIWLIGFVVRVGEGGSRGRWYHWLPSRRRYPAVASGSPGFLAPRPGPAAAPEPVPGASWSAASAASTLSYIGSRSARPVIHSALVYR